MENQIRELILAYKRELFATHKEVHFLLNCMSDCLKNNNMILFKTAQDNKNNLTSKIPSLNKIINDLQDLVIK